MALPLWLIPELERHFADYAELLPEGRVFVGLYGVTPARPNFSPVWARALKKAGLSGIHVHDLRHTRNHFAAISGGFDARVDERMGHVSVKRSVGLPAPDRVRDRAIADSLDAMVGALKQADVHGSGHVEGTGDWLATMFDFSPGCGTCV